MKYPDFPKKGEPEYKLHRRLEMIPGILTWGTLLGSFVLAFLAPVAAVIIIIIYDLYWLIKVITITVHSILAYGRMKYAIKVDWLRRCRRLGERDGLGLDNVYHLIVIPYYSEGLEILEPAIRSITESNYPLKNVIVSMSSEERAGKEANQRQEVLKKRYGHHFKAFLTNIHQDQSGEMKIKANNANCAARKAVAYLKTEKIDLDKVIASNFDCDTCIQEQYLASVTYNFIKNQNRYRLSYQPLPMYNNNIWDAIAIVRIVALGCSFWHMIESTRPERLVTFSSHSMSLRALLDVGFWQPDVISDDSAIFWQCYLYYDGDYEVQPLYIPVSMDATLAGGFIKTIVNQYKQKRRWAYGIENFPRIARAFLKNKKIPFLEKSRNLFIMLEGHHSWATSSLLILLLGWLPLIIGGNKFNETVISHSLPMVTRNILTVGMGGLLVSLFLSFFLIPPKPKRYSNWKYFSIVFQWLILPFVAPLFGLPAIDSQTRLLFGKYFDSFWVSEKIRKRLK
ncbi:MAG: hypothetical protein GF332_04440 [Candidatus Moranbacteria bacterium]|nr:hypothetical protein [Candidatus Moranbacteria bacterium]